MYFVQFANNGHFPFLKNVLISDMKNVHNIYCNSTIFPPTFIHICKVESTSLGSFVILCNYLLYERVVCYIVME
jgi:hypothetical protein